MGGFLVAALLGAPGWGAEPPQPGTLNYIEGRATLDSQALSDHSVGSARMAAGQSLSTQDGRAEILLAPGIFLRIDHQSTVQMVNRKCSETLKSQ